MYNEKIRKLDEIIEKTVDSIKQSHDEVVDISMFAKSEYESLLDEFKQLKADAIIIIENVEKLEKELKKSKAKLLLVNKKFSDYSEQEMREVYEKTDQLRTELLVEKEKEANIIKRRNELELHLKSVQKISEKADQLCNNFDMAYGLISGDLKQVTEKLQNNQGKELLGIKAIEAQELERKRIARDMHDGPTQKLSNLILKTELCIKLLDKDIDRTKLELQSLKMLIRDTIDETRRLIYNLRPMSIDDLGLIPTLERLIDKMNQESNCNIRLDVDTNNRDLDPIVTLTLYRITQEALNNVRKHAKATQVFVDLKITNDLLTLSIKDNGEGFNMEKAQLDFENNRGFGLAMMEERVNLLLGTFEVTTQIGKGTSVEIKIPIQDKKEENTKWI